MRPLQKQRPKPTWPSETLGWLPIPLVTRDYEPHVAIVIPVFNESKGLEQTYEAVDSVRGGARRAVVTALRQRREQR